MRRTGAALDLVQQNHVDRNDNGLECFIPASRRQHFLVPPRAHRAFPLLELEVALTGEQVRSGGLHIPQGNRAATHHVLLRDACKGKECLHDLMALKVRIEERMV